MGRKILAVSLALLVVLSFTACGEDETPPAEEIVDNTIQAMADISTFECEMEASTSIAGEEEGEVMEMTMDIDYSGALDLDNRQMWIDMAISAEVPFLAEAAMDLVMEAYLLDGTGYIMTDSTDTEPTWEKEEFSEAEWEETWEQGAAMLNVATPQTELLEASEVEVIGSETVNGVDCYVLRLTPDMAQLWESAIYQSTLGFAEEMGWPEFSPETFAGTSYSFSVQQWIAKDSYFLMKAEIDISMELTAEAMGYAEEEGEMNLDLEMTMLAYNYNQPISIELPPEAEAATAN